MLLLYLFFKAVVRAGFWVFYEKTTLLGWDEARFRGPVILASNHPATLLDPLNVAARAPRHVHFLANYSLFKNPVAGWLLRHLWCIPIQRREDVAAGQPLQNREAFAACDEFLGRGGCLFMAPEGSSFVERKIRPLKTGMARIAFSAEEKSGWRLGLAILPFGLTYSEPTEFRGKVWVKMGVPVKIADWRGRFEADERQAINELTDFVEEKLRDLTLSTADDADEIFQRQLETIVTNEADRDGADHFFKTKEDWETHRRDGDLKARLSDYFAVLASLKLADRGVSDFLKKKNGATSAILLALGAPVAAAGAACWFLPCFLPWLAVRKIRPYPGYDPTLKFSMGLFTFPLGGLAVFLVSKNFGLNNWQSMLCVVAAVLAGLAAWEWWLLARRFWEGLAAQSFFEKEKAAGEKLAEARRCLTQKIGNLQTRN